MRRRLTIIFFGVLAILLIGTPVGQAQTVVEFTILGPRVVLDDDQNSEVTFTVYVAATDANWRPILPVSSATITLTAYEAGTQNQLTMTAGSSFQSSATDIWTAVQVTLTGLNPNTEIAFRAAGHNAGPSGSNAPSTRVANSPGSDTSGFCVNTPHSANPGEPFPLIITPVNAQENDPNSQPTDFTGDLSLTVDEGNITPTTVSLNLQAGESHQVMVTLDAVSPSNNIHVKSDVIGVPEHVVVFINENVTTLGDESVLRVHPMVELDDTPLSFLGVTDTTKWESTIWPIEQTESEQGGGGWNIMTSIPGIGQNNEGIQFHDIFIPRTGALGAVVKADLPGDPTYWNEQTITLGADNWKIVTGTFPEGLAGDYWHRRFFLSHGQFPRIDATFEYHSAMFDQVLELVEMDGSQGGPEEPLSEYGVKGTTWTASLWRAEETPEVDPVFHMFATFDLPIGPVNGVEENRDYSPVTLFLSFTPSARTGGPALPGIFLPDSLWNQNYLTLASEFQNTSGGPLPADFTTGTFWNRVKVLRDPDEVYEGWSQSINTTGEHVILTTLRVHRTLVEPGGLAEVLVQLDHPNHDVAGVQFDLLEAQGTTFLGAISFQKGAGFNISANTANGTTIFLMTNMSGGKLNANQTDFLMKLVYQVDPGVSIGDSFELNPVNSVLSGPGSNAIEHNTESGFITIGRIGDLVGTDGAINVTDLTRLISFIIGVNPSPASGELEFFKADLNRDNAINILDVQRMVNIIIGRATAKQIAGATGPVRLEIGAVRTLTQGQITLPVQIQSGIPIAGIQLTLSYDPGLVSLGTVIPDARLDGMLIEQYVSAGELRILIVSPDGGTFTASTLSTILAWPVTLHDERGGEVRLNEVIVANTQATGLQTVITRDRVKVAAAPEAFALLGNQPNPFNPNTQITYEVPQQSHITLTVFNLLGQEVIRLVDQVQTPGRYVVTWNARNANGLSVSSGVYMYRLVTSAGAVDTKRMTLLK